MSTVTCTNLRTIRDTNELIVLDCLRKCQPISASEISRRIGVQVATTGKIVQRLHERGLVENIGTSAANNKSGRPPTLLQIRSGARHIIGVDVASTHGTAVLVDLLGRPVLTQQFDWKRGGEIWALKDVIGKILRQAALKQFPVEGIGIAASSADPLRGTIGMGESIQEVSRSLESDFGLATLVEENGNAFALAEKYFGLGLHVPTFLCCWYRYGVGHGLVIEGKIYRGCTHSFGEMRSSLVPPKRACKDPDCPARELLVRPQVLAAWLRAAPEPKSELAQAVYQASEIEGQMDAALRAMQAQDPLVLALVEKLAFAMSIGISTLADFLDVELIILGGPITLLGDAFLVLLREYVSQLADKPRRGYARIELTRLDQNVIACGGAALHLENLFGNIPFVK